jgi:cytochrome P450
MLLGAPLERWRLWSDGHHRTVAAMPTGPDRDQATAEMMQIMGDLAVLVGETRANPPTGEPKNLIEVLCTMEVGGRQLTNDEIILHAILITAGGTDTSTTALTLALKWLDCNPEVRQRLADAGPELMATAVEEFIRVSAPVTALARTAKCPIDVGDQHLGADERVLMFYAAANYDPDRFPDPERVDIERSPNPHTSFGLSSHRCIGMHFARLELDVVLREVLKRMPDCKVDHDGARRNADVGVNQGWVKLPITFTPGARLGSTFRPAEA